MKAMIAKVGICVWLGVIVTGTLVAIYFIIQLGMDLVKALS